MNTPPDLLCECGQVLSAETVAEQVEALKANYPSAQVTAVICLDCKRITPITQAFVSLPQQSAPRSAQEVILQIRHHVQLALGDLAKLARTDLVSTPARNVIEQRLYKAIALADSFDPSPILNLPGLR